MPSQQQNQLSKVIYKVCTLITHTQPDPMSTHEMIAIVNPETYTSWLNGDKTIPLADVVDTFHIYSSDQGSQGLLGQASKQELSTVFGTSNMDDALIKLLETGKLQPGSTWHQLTSALKPNEFSGRNASNTGGHTVSGGSVGGGR